MTVRTPVRESTHDAPISEQRRVANAERKIVQPAATKTASSLERGGRPRRPPVSHHPHFGTPKPEMRLGFAQLDWDFLHDEWDFGAHSRAFATHGFDGQLSADHFNPFFHANEAQTPGIFGRNRFLDKK